MQFSSLALNGGERLSDEPFRSKPSLSFEDIEKAREVLNSGVLSDFFGSPGDHFYGGPQVKRLETNWLELFGYNNAITVNSWTTGLVTCLKACGIGYGDEVICTPLTMSATASAILECGGIPIFCDVDEFTLNISPSAISKVITSRTKAIMVVHLFGLPADMDDIIKIAKQHNIYVIEDAAHAPLAKYKGRNVGALGDIGGFSLNYHKHIHCGEGGVIVSENPYLAERCRLIRNHGENALDRSEFLNGEYIVGSNYRLTELQAAIAASQLRRLGDSLSHRANLNRFLSDRLSHLNSLIKLPFIDAHRTHSFYCYPIHYDQSVLGLHRNIFVKAVNKEFPRGTMWDQQPMSIGYSKPLYMNSIYHEPRILKSPFPIIREYVDYYKTLSCPIAEQSVDQSLILLPIVHEGNNEGSMEWLCKAIEKVVYAYS